MTDLGEQLRALAAEIAPDRPAEQIMLKAADEITRLKARCEVLERVIHNVEAWHMVPDEDQKT